MVDCVQQDGVPSYDSLNIDTLYQTYPKSNFPATLKQPSSKSKLSKISEYETIIDNYEDEARNISFRITAQRLPYWVRAFWIYLYDYVGDKRMYDVTWLDDPNRESVQQIFIEVHSKSTTTTNMLYKLTLFMKTGSVTVQGTNKSTFVNKHFKPLCTIVDMLESKFSASTKVLCDEETLLKIPVNDDLDRTLTEIPQNNLIGSDKKQDGPHNSRDNSVGHSPSTSRIPVRKDQLVPNLTTTNTVVSEVKDIFKQMEQTFADSLTKFCETQQAAVASELTNIVRNMNDTKVKHTDTEYDDKIKALETTISKQNEEIWALRNKVQNLQHEAQSRKNQYQAELDSSNHKYKQLRSDYELEMHIAESNHKVKAEEIQLKLEIEAQKRQTLANEVISQAEKIHSMDTLINQLKDNIRELEDGNETRSNEILSLKLHNSRQHDFVDNQTSEKSEKVLPKVLLIGTSNTSKVDPNRLSAKFKTHKITAYDFVQTKECIEEASSNSFDIICLHSLTNEVKEKSADKCVEEFDEIVKLCNQKWPNAKVLVSLGTPRKDSFNTRIGLVNALIMDKYHNVSNIRLCDHSNLSFRGAPQLKFLNKDDDVHLSDVGVKLFADNLKWSILSCLGITTHYRRHNQVPNQRHGKSFKPKPKRWNKKNQANGGPRKKF